MKKYKIIAVIAAYREEKRIFKTVKNTKKFVDEVIVVDDGSKDRTAEMSENAGAIVIKYEENKGAGYATRIGLKKAIEMKPEFVVILDGDGQLNPKYIPKFIDALEKGADYVYGIRDLSRYPITRKIGNFGLTLLANLFCYTGIKDVECGYRAMKLDTLKKLNLKANRYEREMDFAYEVWKNKLKIEGIKIKVLRFYPKFAVARGFKNFLFLLERRFGE
jgi:glycosyltransferase involved in cell wall biosynthesis